MTTRFSGQYAHGFLVGMVVVLGLFISVGTSVAQSKAGKLLLVKVKGPDGEFAELKFRYCPNKKLKSGSVGPLYLMELELTEDQFRIILGNNKYQQFKNKLKNVNEIFSDELKGGNYPIPYLMLPEVVDVCQQLQKLNQEQNPGGVFNSLFRIPSHTEWKYACLAGEEKEGQHFGIWPGDDFWLKNPKFKVDGKELWDKAAMDDPDTFKGAFTGTQNQFVLIAKKYPGFKDGGGAYLLWQILERMGVTNQDPPDFPGNMWEVGKHPPKTKSGADVLPLKTTWGFADMHGNVSEWCLTCKDGGPSHTWKQLLAKDPGQSCAIVGGGFAVTFVKRDFELFLANHPRYLSLPEAWPPGQVEFNTLLTTAAGIRILMEKQYSLAKLRIEVMTKEPNAALTQKLAAEKESLAEVLPEEQLTTVKGQIDYYISLAHMRAGDTTKAREYRESVLKNETTSEEISSFLKLQGHLMKAQ